MGKHQNLLNKTFNRLTVIQKVNNKWLCVCVCGKTKLASSYRLRTNRIKSCGCFQQEFRKQFKNKRKFNLVGKVFTRLTVLKDSGSRDISKEIIWECFCQCGKRHKVSTGSLMRGSTRSCGCLARETAQKLMTGKFGKLSYQYNPNISDFDRQHRRIYPAYIEWRKQVYARDNYKCQCCNTSRDIVAHHLEAYHANINLRTRLENGITLCVNCHNKFHKIYGKKFNTKKQFEEFMRLK